MERSLTFTGIHQNIIPTFQQSVQYTALMTKPQWLLHVSGFLSTALDTSLIKYKMSLTLPKKKQKGHYQCYGECMKHEEII